MFSIYIRCVRLSVRPFRRFVFVVLSDVSVVLRLITVIVQRVVGVLVDGDSTSVEHTDGVACASETEVVLVGVHVIAIDGSAVGSRLEPLPIVLVEFQRDSTP